MAIKIEAMQTGYVPGVCNIGPAEIQARRRAGWVGVGITILLWGLFFVFHVPAPWRLFLFLPAALAATGFLQAAMHFCAGFGRRGVFNFGAEIGKTDTVEQAESKAKDQKKATQIGLYSLLIGIVVALAGFFVLPV